MRCIRILLPALLTIFTALAGSAAESGPNLARIYAGWSGQWTGVLEYRDYQPPHGRVALPTTLSVTPAPDAPALILRFVYNDSPHKTVKSASRLTLDLAARRLTWSDEGKPATPEDTFTLAEASASGDELVFEGHAMDDNKPSRVRYTITTTPGSWRILKETTSDSPTFSFRHEYRFTHPVSMP
jgi:hypothetical protein